MYTPGFGKPDIFVYGKRLEVYISSTLSNDGSLDAEIKRRINKASGSFGKLKDRSLSDHTLTLVTKVSVYQTCVVNLTLCL